MQQYKNNPDKFKLFRDKILYRSVPLIVIAIAIGFGISYYSQGGEPQGVEVMLVYTCFIAVVLIYSIFRGLKKQREMFDSYELIIAPGYIMRRQAGLADKTIFFEKIVAIEEMKNGYICVKGEVKQDIVAVSPYIEQYEEVKSTLEAVKAITAPNYKNLLQKYQYLLLPLTFASLVVFYISANKIAVASSGALLIALLGWGFYNVRSSTLIDKKAKRNAWWLLVVIISIALALFYRVFSGDVQLLHPQP